MTCSLNQSMRIVAVGALLRKHRNQCLQPSLFHTELLERLTEIERKLDTMQRTLESNTEAAQ